MSGPGVGAAQEKAAAAHLAAAGLKILARNVRYAVGELDLVALDGRQLAFVEVRFRRHADFGGALASVDARKRRRLIAAAALFLAGHPEHAGRACRFDVVAIDADQRIEWVRAAFES
jgi:putative endonuclease